MERSKGKLGPSISRNWISPDVLVIVWLVRGSHKHLETELSHTSHLEAPSSVPVSTFFTGLPDLEPVFVSRRERAEGTALARYHSAASKTDASDVARCLH